MKNNDYESHLMFLWDRLDTLMKYEGKKLTYEKFNEIIDDEDFDLDSVNVSISINKEYERMFGRKMYGDLCRRYVDYRNGKLDEDKKRLYRKWKTFNEDLR
tara:strand:- start:288 stop:590 length:303 start_codon:yes stop_codon:yes gene_type:complete